MRNLARALVPVLASLAACSHGAGSTPMRGGPGNLQTISTDYLIPAASRTFAVEYVGRVSGIPPGTRRLRLWIPVPQDSAAQTIRHLSFSPPPRIGTEAKYGNRIAFWEIGDPGPSVEVSMRFECTRREIRMDLDRLATDGTDPAGAFPVFTRPDALVLVDDGIRRLAGQVTGGRSTTLSQARAIYEHVLERMTYDKNHDGWGLGSTRHACEVGMGNCTDFHALFISLCRARGIPSGFEIGLYLPYEPKSKGENLGGYHCWALFRVPGKSWVPVDCSEADRFPDKKEALFAGHTSNRVALSTGRDITLEPPQAGEPLNYFLDPYAEADGVPLRAGKVWSFADLD